MKTNIFKYLKFLSITAFSSAVMFTAAFGACATTVDVGGKGMTSVGNLTGVSTNLIDPSSAVNVGTLGNATRQEVRFLAVPFASTKVFESDYPDKNLSDSNSELLTIHKDICKKLDNKKFSLGKTNTGLSALWAPLTIERAMSLYPFITIPPLDVLNLGQGNTLISSNAGNYNYTLPLFQPAESGAFGLAAEESYHNYQQFRFDQQRYQMPRGNDWKTAPVALGKLGGAYPASNRTSSQIWTADWFPLCFTTQIKLNSTLLVDDGRFQNDVPLYWYPTLQ